MVQKYLKEEFKVVGMGRIVTIKLGDLKLVEWVLIEDKGVIVGGLLSSQTLKWFIVGQQLGSPTL